MELGGNEIVNSARTSGYMSSGDCPVNWIICPPCDGIADANGDAPYTMDGITDAPWYDVENEPSHRFLGVHALSIEGLNDSTRTATIAEGVTDGGVIGGVRHAVRQVRVRALLSGLGEDALESGLSWLKAALDPDSCGTHGNSCGAADSCFYVACPPTRAQVVKPEAFWNTAVTNLATNPSFETEAGGVVAGVDTVPGLATLSSSTDWTSTGSKSLRITPASATDNDSFANLIGMIPNASALVGKTMSAQIKVRLPAPLTGSILPFALRFRAAVFIAGVPTEVPLNHTSLADPLVAGEYLVSATFAVPAGAEEWGFFRIANGASLGNGDVWVDDFMLIEGEYGGPYFDGSFPDSTEAEMQTIGASVSDYEWTGAAHASASTHRSGTVVAIEDPEAYATLNDSLLRSMHNVTCISGPLIEQKLHRGEMWGYLVEFTLAAGTPWLFGVTKPVEIPPSLPVIVQDVPFNLMPHPSAELSSGTVVVARNLSTNPSVEVNGDTWNPWWAVVTGASPQPFLTSGRSTELAAGGSSASFLHRLLGNNGATAITNAESRIASTNVVQLGAYTPGTRFSFSIWGAALIVAGGSGSAILELGGYAEWRNAADQNIGAVQLGTTTNPADFGGKVFSAKSQPPPAGATSVHIYVIATVRWSSSATAANNSDIRVYADTVAVTIP